MLSCVCERAQAHGISVGPSYMFKFMVLKSVLSPLAGIDSFVPWMQKFLIHKFKIERNNLFMFLFLWCFVFIYVDFNFEGLLQMLDI